MTSPALVPIRRSTLTLESVGKLRRAILSGELPEGTVLPEAATAAKLGVSRVPVREALVELERQGLVEFGPTGRASVRRLDPRDLEEIMSLRATLQGMAARLAAERMTPAALRRLDAVLARTEKARDLTELSMHDMAFHDEIVAIAGHGRLARAWSDLRPQIELWLTRLHRKRERRSHDVREATLRAHRELVRVLRGNPERAGRTMERHCNSWGRALPGAS